MKRGLPTAAVCAAGVAWALIASRAAAQTAPVIGVVDSPFDAPIVESRPRIFLRNDDSFAGLTVAKLRKALRTPEFAHVRPKLERRPLGRAILWLVDGRRADLDAAIRGLRSMEASQGSWSDRGIALIDLCTLFDWLYDELDDDLRRQVVRRIEAAADAAVEHIRRGRAPFYYSRTPGALAGMTLAGIALNGCSDKSAEYLTLLREWGVTDYFEAYAWVDGAATGATYTFFYTYVDLAALCAAWWSATGENPNDWIRVHRGDWLDGIVRFYLWYLRPGFAFTPINDQARGDWATHDQFCQALDLASYVTRNGHGRAWSLRWLGRFGSSLYHTEYAHRFAFRDVTLKPRPLDELPLAELFGRESCGYGFFRSGWPSAGKPDTATHVFFRCGDPLNVHGGVAAGEFQVFKYAPLAGRSGRYASYDSAPDQYHRNCISTNVVLFTDPREPDDRGDQHTRRGLKSDHRTWKDWLRVREKHSLDVATITHWSVEPGVARCRADLSRSVPKSKCRRWIREFVWLAREHLIVLDVVETSRADVRRQWQLHLPRKPRLADHEITVENEPPQGAWATPALAPTGRKARLHCQTLLPTDYRVLLHTGGDTGAFDEAGVSLGSATGNPYHLEHGNTVVQIDAGTRSDSTVFLHVLTAVDASDDAPPRATVRRVNGETLEVRVGDARARLVVLASAQSY